MHCCARDHGAELAELLGIAEILRIVKSIQRQVADVRRAITTEGDRIMEDLHAELGADLADLATKIAEADTELARELADFAALVAPKLSDDERTQLAALGQKLVDFKTAIDTADPAPAPPPA